jgi:hypothetical protein
MATTTIQGSVSTSISFMQQEVVGNIGTASFPCIQNFNQNYFSSTITKLYSNTISVTTTPTSLNLNSLTDAFGNAQNFGSVKSLYIQNTDPTNSVTIGGGTTPLFAAQSPIAAGECYSKLNSNLSTSSANLLQIVASAGSVSINIVIAGS